MSTEKYPKEVKEALEEASDEFKEIIRLAEKLVEMEYAERRYYAGKFYGYRVCIPTGLGCIDFDIDVDREIISDAWLLYVYEEYPGRKFVSEVLVTHIPDQLVEAMKLLAQGDKEKAIMLFEENLETLIEGDLKIAKENIEKAIIKAYLDAIYAYGGGFSEVVILHNDGEATVHTLSTGTKLECEEENECFRVLSVPWGVEIEELYIYHSMDDLLRSEEYEILSPDKQERAKEILREEGFVAIYWSSPLTQEELREELEDVIPYWHEDEIDEAIEWYKKKLLIG